MTPQQLDAVRRTGSVVLEDPTPFATSVYERIFACSPEMRELFGDDLDAHYRILVDELTFLVHAAADLSQFVDRARRLGARHADYGAGVTHFATMRVALLEALGEALGPAWDGEVAAAWAGLYDLVAETMLEGAAERLFAQHR